MRNMESGEKTRTPKSVSEEDTNGKVERYSEEKDEKDDNMEEVVLTEHQIRVNDTSLPTIDDEKEEDDEGMTSEIVRELHEKEENAEFGLVDEESQRETDAAAENTVNEKQNEGDEVQPEENPIELTEEKDGQEIPPGTEENDQNDQDQDFIQEGIPEMGEIGEERNEDDGNEMEAGDVPRDEEEFADAEDQELKQVTEEDENLQENELVTEEGGLPTEHLENLEQEDEYENQLEEGNTRPDDKAPTEEVLETDDLQPRISSVVPASPHSYHSGGSGRHTAIGYGENEEEKEEEEEEEEDKMEHDSSRISREELVEKYYQALTERQQMQEQNYQLQHKLSEFFRKKRSDDSRQDDRNMADQEQRYLKNMAILDELRQEERQRNARYRAELDELKMRCAEKQEEVDHERLQLMEYKKEVALKAINSRTGKTVSPKDVEQYLNAEGRKESEVVAVRLENIKLKNRLRKEEMALKSKEELAEGLHLIDFEQLKIENQTYNEKIEERNEELLKLRRKITNTVQVLTHLKEKLQFVQNENHAEKAELRTVEELVGKRRDALSRLKQARDALRFDNQNIHQNGGLLGNNSLLRDFEDRKDEADELNQKLDQLRMRHAELTLSLKAVRKKIENSKQR